MSDPYSVQLEQDALGQMVAFHAFPQYLAAGVIRSDFYRDVHQRLFDVLVEMDARGSTIDVVSVRAELRRRDLLDEIGGDHYLGRLTNDVLPVPTPTVESIAKELGELATVRAFASATTVAEAATTIAKALHRTSEGPRAYTSAGQLEAIDADIARDAAGRVWLGFETLDGILEGIRPGEVCGLMARPGIGKTLVFCHTACRAADEDFGHVFFSLEMPAAQISQRLARAHYGLSAKFLRERRTAGVLDSEDYIQAFRRLVVVDTPGLTVGQMGARLRHLQTTYFQDMPIRLVTIDHLGLIGGDRKMSTYDRVSTQARELKEFAKRFDCVVLLAVQVNREAGGDGSKELHLGSARDSGVVEEAMDYLIAMRRLDRAQTLAVHEREKYRDALFLKVVKNRHGAPDTEIGVRLDGMTLRLREDPDLRIPPADLDRLAASIGKGRR